MPRHLGPPPLGLYTIVCPYCETKEPKNVSDSFSDSVCSKCGKSFVVLLATIRAKRGRREKKGYGHQREYILRIITSDNLERVLQFTDEADSNLDLRSRDIMYACFKKINNATEKTPSILCNVSTRQYTPINPAWIKWSLADRVKASYNGKIFRDIRSLDD